MAIKLHKSLSNIETISRWQKGEATDIKIYNIITEREKFKKEGEEWEIKGIKYKKQNGKTIKLTKSQGDIIRECLNQKCKGEKCGQVIKWGTKRDLYFYNRTGLCENCLIDYETKLRILGFYDTYERYKLASYALGDLKDRKETLKDIVIYFTKNNGDVNLPCEDGVGNDAVWKNTNKDKILKDAKEDLKKVKKLITNASKFKQFHKIEYEKKCKEFNLSVI